MSFSSDVKPIGTIIYLLVIYVCNDICPLPLLWPFIGFSFLLNISFDFHDTLIKNLKVIISFL